MAKKEKDFCWLLPDFRAIEHDLGFNKVDATKGRIDQPHDVYIYINTLRQLVVLQFNCVLVCHFLLKHLVIV